MIKNMYDLELENKQHVLAGGLMSCNTPISEKNSTPASFGLDIPCDCSLPWTSFNGSGGCFLVLLEALGELSAMEV